MSRRDISVGGRWLGVSTRADGRTRANFLSDPATGRRRQRWVPVLALVAAAVILLIVGGVL